MSGDFTEKRNAENINLYDIHMVSFRRVGEAAYSPLCLGQGQKPEAWHIEKFRELVRAYEAGEFDDTPEDDYCDLC